MGGLWLYIASWCGAVGVHSNAAQQVCPTTGVSINPNPVVPGRDVRLEVRDTHTHHI